tara:strand:- start:732 stop:998 length:267 start_codon:yes stop_codon:yes gene_type:complete
MSKKITINKYEGNTHFVVHVIDSFNQEHHLGYYTHFDEEDIKELEQSAQEIWDNEVKREVDLLGKAIKECIEIDKNKNIISGNYDGLD